MKAKHIVRFAIVYVLSHCFGVSETIKGDILNEKQYLTVIPELDKATVKEDRVTVPFLVTNTYSENIVIIERYQITMQLMTREDSGKFVSLAEFRSIYDSGPWSMFHYSGPTDQITLKPGQSKTYDCKSSVGTLAFALGKNKKIYGSITAHIARTNEEFQSCSAPFAVPPQLTKTPWIDLGEQKYFSITPDLTKPAVESVNDGGFVMSPVKVTNITGQTYIAATNCVCFSILKHASNAIPPSLWEAMKVSAPVLKPGESALSTGTNFIMFKHMRLLSYKPGDEIVAAVAGRIPSTNQLFECYSAPFRLPPSPTGPPSDVK